MPAESTLLGFLTLVNRNVPTIDLEQHRKEHAQAALIARATFVLLHIFILATLFTCGSDLQHSLKGEHRLYVGGFLALLLANAALYVALNLSNPGYLELGKRGSGSTSSTDVEEGREFLIAMTTAVGAKDARKSRQNSRPNQRPFDLGRLLATEMGAYEPKDNSLAGSQTDSDAEDAVSLPSSANHSSAEEHSDNAPASAKEPALHAPLMSAGLMRKMGEGVGDWVGSSREADMEGGLKPDSWHSSLQAPHLASGRPSDDGAPLEAAALGSWADLLPAGGSASWAGGRADVQEPDLASAGGIAPAARGARPADGAAASQGRSTEAADGRQSAAGGTLRADAASDDFLIGAVHHGLLEDSRRSSRTLAWYERACPGRLCEWCGAWQRLRAHHCSLCDRCVDAYDHHCAWIGTCVGARNRPMFVGFLATQTAVLAWSLQAAVSCLDNAVPLVPDSAFFGYDWEVVASIGLLVFLLTFVACLLGYQLFLAATAQTTREHSCGGQVPYLAHVPAHVHPFSRGIRGNLWDFFFENADRDWELPSIEQLVMREHAQSAEHCC
ncbi:probable palmitoyltransferase ERF2 at C-terminar half [Coccomyxa sp. Obi]|nr:probable palmitoyltransferase ERF2 at C-terminar half [Coccomyxa sp. Obi]